MTRFHISSALCALAAACALLAAPSAHAQSVSDAPFVVTPQPLVEAMRKMAGVGPADTVIDLGSGDGRVVITAAKQFGARGIGVELDFHLHIQSEEGARQAGVENRVTFLQEDLFESDLSKATVITLYLLPHMNERLVPKLLALRPGTRIVVHRFPFKAWKPDREAKLEERYFLYVVPARVEGAWTMQLPTPQGAREVTLDIRQRFQEIGVTARAGTDGFAVDDARLAGDRISIGLRGAGGAYRLEGRVEGAAVTGEMRSAIGSGPSPWRATRANSAPRPAQ